MWREPELDSCKPIPIGHKFHVLKLTNSLKVGEKTTTLHALTHDQYSDAMRFLEIDSGKIIISCDFIVTYVSRSSKGDKQTETLPNKVRDPQHECVHLPIPKIPSPIKRDSDD
ncbi:hypothetical protein O181_091527 [Austropuccinia psidii MF-1]|uniref:Uncharacterized protein n=1 Tax=Austropuccinia psidii MF-1 TaxID=1389203 RepID=A0A9Q3P8R1_9BASI|nr:hypothetical protein [Austropuccinia psidii MF-1]